MRCEQILRRASDEAKGKRRSRVEEEELKDARAKRIFKEALKETMADEDANRKFTELGGESNE